MSNMFDRALQLDRETQGQGQQLGGSMFDRAMQIQAEEDAKAQANIPKPASVVSLTRQSLA